MLGNARRYWSLYLGIIVFERRERLTKDDENGADSLVPTSLPLAIAVPHDLTIHATASRRSRSARNRIQAFVEQRSRFGETPSTMVRNTHHGEFAAIESQEGSNSSKLSVKEWVEAIGAFGVH